MKSFHHKKDIFFDLDHTLWDFEKNSALAFEQVFKDLNMRIALSDFLRHYVPINNKYWKLFREEKVNQDELRYFRLKEVFDLLDYPISKDQIDYIAQLYLDTIPNYNYLYDGAIELLEYLKTKYNLHIITNGFEEVQERKLKNSDLANYFITVTNSERAGVKKPHPRIFEYALSLAQAQKESSIMIGDSLDADVEGAINVGLEAILFNEFRDEVSHAIPQVTHLLELKNFF
jgi:YjjG family noncanonical pyrimidine nucleotidase